MIYFYRAVSWWEVLCTITDVVTSESSCGFLESISVTLLSVVSTESNLEFLIWQGNIS